VRRKECSNWAAKDKVSKKKKEEKMRKYTSSLTHPTRHLMVVPEVTIRNSGWWRMRKHLTVVPEVTIRNSSWWGMRKRERHVILKLL
jgi:hypothetical protein